MPLAWYRQDEKGPRGKVKRDPLSHTGDRFPGTSRKRRDTVVLHNSSQEDPEVIRMSQWAEVRQMHVVDGVPKKQIAERLGLDIKTVRRAVAQATAPARRAVSRPRHLDRWRAQIEQWLRQDRRLTAKRIRRLLLPLAGPVAERTVRWYVARLKAAAAPKEVYVHRSPRPGVTLEVDFGESWAEVAGVLRKVKYVVATLPYSNVYFAKAYPIERLESLLDGIQAAFAYMGGVTDRVVLDNTTIAVKQVLTGRDRVQTDAFQAFRGAYPFAAAFCAPAKGWEKGSVETGVKYVRNLVFRPRPTVATWAALNALIITELEADLATRRLADGRPVREAWTLDERRTVKPVHLRIDSSGLSVHVGQLRTPPKARDYRKLHLAVDEQPSDVVACALTSKRARDASRVASLVGQIERPIASAKADAAYDTGDVYKTLENHRAHRSPKVLIPPRKGLSSRSTPRARDSGIVTSEHDHVLGNGSGTSHRATAGEARWRRRSTATRPSWAQRCERGDWRPRESR